MFITAKLVFENYIPNDLVSGLWFKQRVKDVIYGKIYEYDRIFELNHTPANREEFIITNGYPVRPMIMSITANPDEPAITLATHEQIGWWDEDPSSDEMRDIELKDINMILSECDGEIEIEVEYHEDQFGEEFVSSILYMDKVTLAIPGTHDEPDYDDYDEDTPPDDYEDMDWEDDLTDDEPDSAGFTQEDRCPKYDADHETE